MTGRPSSPPHGSRSSTFHGDSDTVVPLDANSAALKKRYAELGGPVEVSVLAGRGHDMWSGWFQSHGRIDQAFAAGRDVPPFCPST